MTEEQKAKAERDKAIGGFFSKATQLLEEVLLLVKEERENKKAGRPTR